MTFDSYWILIAGGILIGISYVFDVLSNKLKIPSVLFLIGTGMLVGEFFSFIKTDYKDQFFNILELLGIIGLIMIVLEAAVDLKLSRKKLPTIKSSLLMALIILVVSSFAIALAIMWFREENFFNALVYAIPLSVVSSAVLIPSVHQLTKNKREFMIYEATFSDIIGIMFFNFVVLQEGNIFSLTGLGSILLTVVLSFIISYLMVYFFGSIKTQLRLFLMIAILSILYGLGKKLHLSSLLIIFIFGLILNNVSIFFRGWLKQKVDFKDIKSITKDFHLVTSETAFVVRTFFFVAFGMFIDVNELIRPEVLIVGSIITVILYLVRYLNFKIFLKTDVFPEIFLAPRGLITILLFFSIPAQYEIANFSIGILSFVILATSLIMMVALLTSKDIKTEDLEIVDIGLAPSDSEQMLIKDQEPSGPYCEVDPFEPKNKENQ